MSPGSDDAVPSETPEDMPVLTSIMREYEDGMTRTQPAAVASELGSVHGVGVINRFVHGAKWDGFRGKTNDTVSLERPVGTERCGAISFLFRGRTTRSVCDCLW